MNLEETSRIYPAADLERAIVRNLKEAGEDIEAFDISRTEVESDGYYVRVFVPKRESE